MHHQVTNCAHQHLWTSTDISLKAWDVLQCIGSQTVHIRFHRHWNWHWQILLWKREMLFNAWSHKLCISTSVHIQTFLWRPEMFFNALCHKLCISKSIDILRRFPGILRCFWMHCVTNCNYLHLLTSTDIFLEAWDVFQASLQGAESSYQSQKGNQYTIAEGMSVRFVRKGFPTRSHDMTTSPTGFFKMLRSILFTLWRRFLRRWNNPNLSDGLLSPLQGWRLEKPMCSSLIRWAR